MRHHRPAPAHNALARITAWPVLAARAAAARLRDDSGYTTETVIVTSLLAALALAVIAIIVAKVTGLANALNV
jgi:hypothetical protein